MHNTPRWTTGEETTGEYMFNRIAPVSRKKQLKTRYERSKLAASCAFLCHSLTNCAL